jgi:hypothetical protein
MRSSYKIVVRKLDGKKCLVKPKPREINNIKINVEEIGC